MFPQGDLLTGRRVLVIGFARQGQALARWLPTVGAYVTVNDRRLRDDMDVDIDDFSHVKFVLGDHPLQLLDETDIVCISGGVPLTLPIIQDAMRRHIPVTNDAQLFLERCPTPIIGITGSAGKTTTTTLVGAMCKQAGIITWVGGNIGNVLLDVMMGMRAEHQVVMELSSFQLELFFSSPQVSAILNITPNHLDRHGTMEEYIKAKSHIIAYQTPHDRAILNRDDQGSRLLEDLVAGDLLWFSSREMVSDGAFMVGQRLVVTGMASPDGNPHVVCSMEDITLRGQHNVSNVLAACAIAGAIGIEPKVMAETIKTFQPVPHRMEIVRELNGITYINDSIATAPERVLAALNSYNEPLVLLAGGADKNLPWDEMVALALHKSRHIIAFGRDGNIVVETVRKLTGRTDQITRVDSLEEAVALAAKIALTGDIVLLSPGGTSYDAYKDFVERGEHFRQLVLAL